MHLAHFAGKTNIEIVSGAGNKLTGETMMKAQQLVISISASIMMAIFVNPAMAGKPDGKGGGKDKDGSSGGNGFNTPNPISLTISIKSDTSSGNEKYFGIQGDGSSYSDGDPAADFPLDVHIDGDSGGSYGNLFLRTDFSVDRSVSLDIKTGCVDGCDDQPFDQHSFHLIGLMVAANESIAGGFCGMQDGQTISAPMQITYYDPAFFGIQNPGFVDFFPVTKGKSQCKGSPASDVSVLRIDGNSWTVSGDAACITWPGGRDFGGVALMPFEFSASINTEETQICD